MRHLILATALSCLAVLNACGPAPATLPETPLLQPTAADVFEEISLVGPTPLPTRSSFPAGTLLDYKAQSGDTLPALAARFNTTVVEIRGANPTLPKDLTTFPPGFPIRIPAYHHPLNGTPFKILPDSELINGPSAIDFDLAREIRSRPGFLSELNDYAYRVDRPAWGVVEAVAGYYSLHPRLLLTLLEHQSGALSNPFPESALRTYPLGFFNSRYQGLFRQLLWASERLMDGYYGWRDGSLREFELLDGYLVRPDAWQNAASVAVQYLFAGMLGQAEFEQAIGPGGLAASYRKLWGDPFEREIALFPGNLEQPPWALPFEAGKIWDFTGGPHSSWGSSLPWGALDFAPPSAEGGCVLSMEWVTAPASGIVTDSEAAGVILDMDGDGDQRTGWNLFFFHLAEAGKVVRGSVLEAGDPIGHPSCEGGRSTGTHVHIARRYNGEWLPAAGVIPFTMDGWITGPSQVAYEGTLIKGSKVVPACTCSKRENRILHELDSR